MTGSRLQYKNDLQFLIFKFLRYFSGEGLALIVAYRKAGHPDLESCGI